MEIFSDLSDKKSIELQVKELEEMAFLDTLTRLANRSLIKRADALLYESKDRRRNRLTMG